MSALFSIDCLPMSKQQWLIQKDSVCSQVSWPAPSSCQLQVKVHEVLVNCLVKLAQEKKCS